MQCKLCLEEKPLIGKSHIIPRQFFHKMSEDVIKGFGKVPHGEKVNRIYSKDARSKQTQSGIHVPDILCGECEQKLGEFDNYAQTLLLKDKPTKKEGFVSSSPLVSLWEIKNFEYNKLKLFFLSVLFRSHVCNHDVFKDVDLANSLENELREMIIQENPGDENKFPIFLWAYKGKASGYVSVQKCQDLSNGYLFRLSDYSCIIQLDNSEIINDVVKMTLLTPINPLKIFILAHEKSHDYKIISKAIHKYQP